MEEFIIDGNKSPREIENRISRLSDKFNEIGGIIEEPVIGKGNFTILKI